MSKDELIKELNKLKLYIYKEREINKILDSFIRDIKQKEKNKEE